MNTHPETNIDPCGSWLASDGDMSVPDMQSGSPLSLASQLPQGMGAGFQVAKHDLIWCTTAALFYFRLPDRNCCKRSDCGLTSTSRGLPLSSTTPLCRNTNWFD